MEKAKGHASKKEFAYLEENTLNAHISVNSIKSQIEKFCGLHYAKRVTLVSVWYVDARMVDWLLILVLSFNSLVFLFYLYLIFDFLISSFPPDYFLSSICSVLPRAQFRTFRGTITILKRFVRMLPGWETSKWPRYKSDCWPFPKTKSCSFSLKNDSHDKNRNALDS